MLIIDFLGEREYIKPLTFVEEVLKQHLLLAGPADSIHFGAVYVKMHFVLRSQDLIKLKNIGKKVNITKKN